jgi:hypothetical protein
LYLAKAKLFLGTRGSAVAFRSTSGHSSIEPLFSEPIVIERLFPSSVAAVLVDEGVELMPNAAEGMSLAPLNTAYVIMMIN